MRVNSFVFSEFPNFGKMPRNFPSEKEGALLIKGKKNTDSMCF